MITYIRVLWVHLWFNPYIVGARKLARITHFMCTHRRAENSDNSWVCKALWVSDHEQIYMTAGKLSQATAVL